MQGDGSLVIGGTRKISDSNSGDFAACKLDSTKNGVVVSTWEVQYSTGLLVKTYAIKK